MAEPIRWQDAWWYQQPDGSWARFNDSTQEWEPVAAQTQPVYAPSAGMSTGAKWAIGLAVALVAFLIISILAAIAIPVFLRQREKAWISQVEAGLKNVAVAQESYCAVDQSPRCYATSVNELDPDLVQLAPEVDIQIARADNNSYCLEGRHEMLPHDIWSYDSTSGRPREGPCM